METQKVWASKLERGDVIRECYERANPASDAFRLEVLLVTRSPENTRMVCLYVRDPNTGCHRWIRRSTRTVVAVIDRVELPEEVPA